MGGSGGARRAIFLAVLSLALSACGGGSGGGAPGAAGGAASVAGASQGGGGSVAPSFQAGAAAVDATPPPGGPLAGFGAPPRREMSALTIPLQIAAVFGACFDPDPSDERTFFGRSQGTLDPIMARALVLSNGATKAAIVKIDAIASSKELHDELVLAAAPLGIPPENLMLCATHTHSGPGAISRFRIWQVIAADCFNQRSYDRMRDAAVKALRDADQALRPAEIGIGRTTCTSASRNRRGRPGIYDPEVGILKVLEKGSGAPIAAAVNFAVHGTALGGSSMLYSADVMGVCERRIEMLLGGGVALFLNGAEGDVSPEGGMSAGEKIGDALVSAWPSLAVKDWVEIRGAKSIVNLPHPVVQTGCIPIPGGSKTTCDFIPGLSMSIRIDDDWVPKVAPFQALRIDRSVFATIPGEPITEIGWEVKRRASAKGFDHGFVVGLANEHISYVTNLAEYVRGEYEGASTIYGPGTGDLVVNSCDAVMDQVKP